MEIYYSRAVSCIVLYWYGKGGLPFGKSMDGRHSVWYVRIDSFSIAVGCIYFEAWGLTVNAFAVLNLIYVHSLWRTCFIAGAPKIFVYKPAKKDANIGRNVDKSAFL